MISIFKGILVISHSLAVLCNDQQEYLTRVEDLSSHYPCALRKVLVNVENTENDPAVGVYPNVVEIQLCSGYCQKGYQLDEDDVSFDVASKNRSIPHKPSRRESRGIKKGGKGRDHDDHDVIGIDDLEEIQQDSRYNPEKCYPTATTTTNYVVGVKNFDTNSIRYKRKSIIAHYHCGCQYWD